MSRHRTLTSSLLATTCWLVLTASASATVITSPAGTVSTGTIKAGSVGHVVLKNPIADIACTSTLETKIESHGNGVTAKGSVSALSFTSCANEWHVTVSSPGTLEVHWTSGTSGTVTSSGTTLTAVRAGTSCRYITTNTHIGTITGGTPARIHLEGFIPFHSGSPLCGTSPTAWTGTYKVSSPSSLLVDAGTEDPSTQLTSPTGTIATPTIKAESEGYSALDHPLASFECQWTIEGTVESHGEGEPAAVPLNSLTTTGCTDSWHATTVAPGELKVDSSGAYDGTVTWDGATVEMTRFGTTCRYKTAGTDIGTLTGGEPATIDVEGAIPLHGGSPLCGETAIPLTGSLKVVSPTSLFADEAQVGPGTSITTPTGTVATPPIKAESEGHVVLDNPIATINCASSVEGEIEGHGEDAGASGGLAALSFTGCTNNWHVTVLSAGELEAVWISGYNGTVKSYGATIEATRFGVNCRYFTANTHIGTITGGTPATMHLEAKIPFHSGSPLCGASTTAWTGSYKITSPSSLFVDKTS